jgi:hypothetical protein
MKPTLHIILLCAGILAAVVAAALLADAWLSARHDSQQLSATLAAQKTQLQAAADREYQRDSQLAAALDAIHAQTRAVRTPQQAAKEIPSALPPLPLPVTIHFPALPAPVAQAVVVSRSESLACRPAQSSGPPQIGQPEVEDPGSVEACPPDPAPATISVPQPDLLPLYADLQNCRAAALESQAAQKDLADEKARSASLLHERDAALATARGGTFLTRLKRSAKWFAIGVAAGAAATAIAHH